MALQGTDLLLVNRSTNSYSAKVSDIVELAASGNTLGIGDVLSEENTADASQVLRFKFTEDDTLPYYLDHTFTGTIQPLLLDSGIASSHRALASSWTTHVAGEGGLHTDITSNYVASYILDESDSPDAMAKMWTNGISIFQKDNVSWTDESWSFDVSGNGLEYNNTFGVTPQGSVTAKEANFKGPVEIVTPGDDPHLVYTRFLSSGFFINARDSGRIASLNEEKLNFVDSLNKKSLTVGLYEITAEDATVTAKEFIGDGSKLTNLPVQTVDAYTKSESDAKYAPLDLRTLTVLPAF